MEERKKILEMLAGGKINTDEAEKLLEAISEEKYEDKDNISRSSSKLPRYLRVKVEPGPESEKQDKVDIRVPLKLIRAGVKFASLIPKNARGKVNDALLEKGIEADINNIKPEDLDEIFSQLDDILVNVEGKETVRIFCE
ncbi:MAG: hypothetical protein PHU65_07290 [Actinomycetota bacterium]|nr:hypothetical protein [Actinomycetota bacterium]